MIGASNRRIGRRRAAQAALVAASLLGAWASPSQSHAQREWMPRRRTIQVSPSLHFRRLGKSEGLPELHVRAIAQDPAGFIWLGGAQSLARYDGREIVVMRAPADETEDVLTSGFITELLPSARGGLWVGTGDGGLNYYDPTEDHFESFRHDPDDSTSLPSDGITSLLEVEGGLWVGTTGGLAYLDFNAQAIRRVRVVSDADSAPPVTALSRTGPRTLWVGTEGSGLLRLDNGEATATSYLPWSTITAIHPTSTGRLWVGTSDGISVFEIDSGGYLEEVSPDRLQPIPTDLGVSALLEDRSGRIWIGTHLRGVYCYVPDSNRVLHSSHDTNNAFSVPYSFISDLYEDEGGVIWVGTVLGVATLNPWSMQFERYDALGDPGSHIVDADGTLWSATNHGLARVDRTTGVAVLYEYPSAPGMSAPEAAGADGTASESEEWDDEEVWIRDLRIDSRGSLWLASSSRGVFRFDPRTERFTQYSNLPTTGSASGLASNEVYALAIDARDVVWAGTWGGGVSLFSRADGRFVHANFEGLSESHVYTILPDPEGAGTLWLGTALGLWRVQLGSRELVNFRHHASDNTTLSHDAVTSLLRDASGRFWAGTYGGGLNHLDEATGSFRRYAHEQGLSDNAVQGIMEDADQNLWLTTDNGLTRFEVDLGRFTTFDWPNGSEFTQSAYYRAPSGNMIVSGNIDGAAGFIIFDPTTIRHSDYVPPVVITHFSVLNGEERLSSVQDVPFASLSYDSVFEVRFAALSFASPASNQYQYKLEGLDEDWIPAESGSAVFNRLPAGTYTLRMRGSNEHARWNEQGVSLKLEIARPPWATWWAYTLYAFIAVGIFSVYVRYQRQRLRAQENKNRLDAVERDLELTGAVQAGFLPQRNTITLGPYEVHAVYRSAETCSGDWWWHESLSGNRFGVLVGDVTGHGPGPAMLTAATASAFRVITDVTNDAMKERLELLNREVLRAAQGKYHMTMTAVELNAETGEFVCYSAGGLPALHLGPEKRPKVLGAPGTPLGSNEKLQLGTRAGRLQPGERLLVFTDGIPEIQTSNGRQLGMRRFSRLCQSTKELSLEGAAQAILQEAIDTLGPSQQLDDWTFVLIERQILDVARDASTAQIASEEHTHSQET